MQKYLLILCSLVMLFSCDKEEITNPNNVELIVGLTYGECLGNCSHFYKLEMDKVYADTEDKWWNGSGDITFESNPLGNETALEDLKAIANEFPSFLIESDETRFGCPDCGDWGALHVIRTENGEERIWTLDNQIESNPAEIQDWANDIQTLIYNLIN